MIIQVYINESFQYRLVERDGRYELRPFAILDRQSQIVSDCRIYDGSVIKHIVDKYGKQVPIVRIQPHNCREHSVCGQMCFCGMYITHAPKTQYIASEKGCIVVNRCQFCEKGNETIKNHCFETKGDKIVCVCCFFSPDQKTMKL